MTGRALGVAVTRAGSSPGRLGRLLRERGMNVVHWPCLRFAPPEDRAPFLSALERLDAYDWAVLSSPTAARVWLQALGAIDPERLPAVAAAGPSTARLLRRAGVPVSCVARPAGWRGLVRVLSARESLAGKRIVIPRSDRGMPQMLAALGRHGAVAEAVIAYRTVPVSPDLAEVTRAVRTRTVDVVTFCSPSAVDGLFSEADSGFVSAVRSLTSLAIGTTTADALRRRGWDPVLSPRPSLDGMAEAASRLGPGSGDRQPGREGARV